jgi:hypothetical protein
MGEGVKQLGVVLMKRPYSSNFIRYEDRLKTFKDYWPSHLNQTPTEMAAAGFFYTG